MDENSMYGGFKTYWYLNYFVINLILDVKINTGDGNQLQRWKLKVQND